MGPQTRPGSTRCWSRSGSGTRQGPGRRIFDRDEQRLGIAAALPPAPRLLLLDEPTAGLDPGGAREVASLVRQLCSDGVTILLSSHQIVEVEDVCHSFTVISRGNVVWDGTADALRAQAPASAYRMSTSNDELALTVAARHPGVAALSSEHGGLELSVKEGTLDSYVLALGRPASPSGDLSCSRARWSRRPLA